MIDAYGNEVHVPIPSGLKAMDPLQTLYYEGAYTARTSSVIASQVMRDIQDSRDPLEALRRHLAFCFARGAAFGHRDRREYPLEAAP